MCTQEHVDDSREKRRIQDRRIQLTPTMMSRLYRTKWRLEFNFDDSLFSPPGHSKGPLTRAQRKENSLRYREIGCVEPEVLDVTAQEVPGQ